MRHTWWLAAACAALVACREARAPVVPEPREVVGSEAPVAPSGPAWMRDDDALAARARSLAARLEVHGITPDPSFEARLFLAARGTRALELDVPAGACRVVGAFASSGMRDLDARLFTPEGELVTEDVAPDPHPSVVFCTAEDAPSRVWLVLDAYDGSGAILLASFAIPEASIDAVASELGGRPGIARSGDARNELERALIRRGFERVAPPLDVPLAAQQTVRVPLRARAGHCYAVVARPVAPLAAIALRLLDLAGAPLVDADDGALQRCEREDVERAIELRATEGEGTVSIVIAEGDDASVGGTPGLWLGTSPRDEPADDSTRSRIVARGALARGETVRHTLRARSGCTQVRVRATDDAAARFALEVVGARRVEAASPSVERCGPAASIDVLVTALGGAASYAIEIAPDAR